MAGATSASASSDGGQRGGGAGRLVAAPAARPGAATANIPNGATSASQSSPCGTSRWRTWPSSWATTSRVSARREVLQQGVVEHDALGVADAGHVGVGGGRAARGVDLVDLADVDAGRARPARARRSACCALRQRRELVEQRVEHDRRRRRSIADAERRPRRPRRASTSGGRSGACRRPAAPPPAPAQHGADRLRLGDVAGPADPGLGHQPDVLGPLARDGAQRQRGQRRARPRAPPRRPRRPAPGAGARRAAARAAGGRAARARPSSISQPARRRATAGRCGSRAPSRAAPALK